MSPLRPDNSTVAFETLRMLHDVVEAPPGQCETGTG